VRDVTIGVQPGEIVGLLGANGAGKTTLIRMLLGLITPSAGDVMLLGGPPSRRTRSHIGYVPQGLGLYDDLTAAENLAFGAAVFGGSPAALPGDLLGVLGASSGAAAAPGGRDQRPVVAQPVGRLPLGTQRRIAFAQALAHRPELLVLDEPTSGVDPLGRARLWDTIGGAARDGAGVLVSTHYMEEAQECDRLIVMADGAVVAAGTAEQIVGDMRVTVVQTASWAAAFRSLADAGLAVALSGRSLRVPGAGPARVTEVLAGPSGRLAGDTVVSEAPATLEERFFDLVLHDGRGRLTAQPRAGEGRT
jgi:ABC-2 type transport system ATP-binding protein